MPTPRSSLPSVLLPAVALSAGILGMCAIWTTAAVLTGSPQAWLALLAAVDMAVLLRLTGMSAGAKRASCAVVSTALAISASYWMIAATQFGSPLGSRPLESALRMGKVLAWELTRLAGTASDLAITVAALLLAAWSAYGSPARR